MAGAELRGLLAPAKINAFLHILGRRADGFHLLQSVFLLIDWCDKIDLVATDQGIALDVLSNEAEVRFEGEDLCVRAAKALALHTRCERGARIGLHKRIPAQAGLGGGSSDAAAVLLGLNRLWGLGLTQGELASIGESLGADVPFFVHGQAAWVEGVGERITPLPESCALPPWALVLKPKNGLATPKVFAHPALQRNTEPATMEGFAARPTGIVGFGRNDMESVAAQLEPQVSQALALVNELTGASATNPHAARMSGSGTAVFGFLPATLDPTRVQAGLKAALPPGWSGKLCGVLRSHPLRFFGDLQ